MSQINLGCGLKRSNSINDPAVSHLPEKTLVYDDQEKHNLSRDDLNKPVNELSSSSSSKRSSKDTDSDFTDSQNQPKE